MYQNLKFCIFICFIISITSCASVPKGFIKPAEPSSDKSTIYFINSNKSSMVVRTLITIITNPEVTNKMKSYFDNNETTKIAYYQREFDKSEYFEINDGAWDYFYLPKNNTKKVMIKFAYAAGRSIAYHYKEVELNIKNDSEYFFDTHVESDENLFFEQIKPEKGKELINNLQLYHIHDSEFVPK